MNESGSQAPTELTISGKWVVGALLVIGLAASATLLLYVRAHVGPFLELRDAIHKEFPDSAPQVEGGQRKMHHGSPRILRITMKVQRDPRTDHERVEMLIRRLTALARRHHDLESYETFELYLIWYRPEKDPYTRHEIRAVKDLPGGPQADGAVKPSESR